MGRGSVSRCRLGAYDLGAPGGDGSSGIRADYGATPQDLPDGMTKAEADRKVWPPDSPYNNASAHSRILFQSGAHWGSHAKSRAASFLVYLWDDEGPQFTRPRTIEEAAMETGVAPLALLARIDDAASNTEAMEGNMVSGIRRILWKRSM